MAERGVEVSYETIRRWVRRFGPQIARRLRPGRPRAHPLWHLDEMYVSIGGRWMYLWRAIDQDGEVLDFLVSAKRDEKVALKLKCKLLKKHGFAPRTIVTDKWKSYAAAFLDLGLTAWHHQAKWKNNRIEGSHVRIRRRELAMQGFRSPGSAQRFLSIHADEIEERIRTEILAALKSATRLDDILDLGPLTPEERLAIYRNATRQAEALEEAQAAIWRSLLASFVRRITVRTDAIDTEIIPSRFEGAIHQEGLESAVSSNAAQADADEPVHTIRIDVRLKRCGGQTRLVLLGDGQKEMLSRPDPSLIKAVASAHVWARQLIRGEVASIADVALREGLSRSHASRLLDLAFLSPDIVEAILEGRQPPGSTSRC